MDIEQALTFTDTLVFAKSGLHLSDLQQAMLRESWSWQRQSYDKIADTYGYSPTYLKHDVGPKLWRLLSEALGEKVNKTSFRAAIERRFQAAAAASIEPSGPVSLAQAETSEASEAATGGMPVTRSRQNWGEAVDVSFFYGRQSELAQLGQWVSQDRCRLITLLGMGGMGKTALSVKLTQQLQNQFEWVIWRSLRNAPPLQETLADLLQFLSNQPETDYPESLDGKLSRLMQHLRSHRCLLVLDNVEAILQPSASNPGNYRQGYEGYGELFRQIGETLHQSCLVLTSREKPQEVTVLEGATLPVRCLQLGGLKQPEGQELFGLKGAFEGSEADWDRLIQGYSGNPLALKIISTTIQNLFDGSIADFLKQEAFVFGSIRHLIEQQFERLSTAEKTVMYWLAVYREPTAFSSLRADIFPPISPQTLIEVLESLEQRSLLEKTTALLGHKSTALFSLQPVVMEYVTDRLVEGVRQELRAGKLAAFKQALCKSHALLKAQTKDYIRETQVRLILQPVADRLLEDLAGEVTLADHLSHILADLRGKPTLEIGYAGGNILNLLCQGQIELSDHDFSRLTIWQAYLQQVNLRNINFAQSDLANSVFAETLGIVFGVAFSPDGTLLATGDAEGGLRLWQTDTGKLLLNFEGHQGWVWSVAFSANGQTLASCSNDKTIRLWDTRTGQCLKTLQGHTSSIWSVAFSADGQTLASGGDEPVIRLWNLQTGTCARILSGHTAAVLSVAFSADGQTLASGSADRTIRLWEVETGECRHLCQGHSDRVWSVAFSSTSPRSAITGSAITGSAITGSAISLASGSADRTIRLWDADTGECLESLEDHSDRVRSVKFSPDGRTLVSGSDDQTVRIWSVYSGQCLQILRGHSNSIFSVSFNADGQTLASGSADQTVRFWNYQTGRCLKTLKGYTNSVFSVAFSPVQEEQILASSSTDQTVRLWDIRTGTCLKTLQGHRGWVTSVAFHPEGHLLASSSADQTVRLWDIRTGTCLNTLEGHSNWVQSVSFSPNGQLLASGGDDRTIRLWSVSTGQCLNTLQGHQSWIWAVAFSLTGVLASSSDDQTVRLWEPSSGQCLKTLEGHTGQIQSIAFSPDGRLLSSASSDETVRLWEVSSGQCLKTLKGHHNNVWSVAFSPDGATLASASLDQTVRLWEINTGLCLRTLPVLTHSVRSAIAFAPTASSAQDQAHLLASGSHNGTIQIWETESGQCLKTLTPDRPYKGTNITGATGITAAQKAALKALGAVET